MATQTQERNGTQPLVPHGSWRVLDEGSDVGFRARKLHAYFVKGRFRTVRGQIDFDPGASSPRGEVVIDAGSVTTRMPPRDWHLRTRDFLDVKRHPEMRIVAEEIRPAGDDRRFTVPATFEIHGERRRVELTAHAEPAAESADQVLLHLEGELDRHDFGIRATLFEWVVGRRILLEVRLLLERIG